ncbi:MAG: hypothetical protein ACSHX5_03940 [Phycisphaerales bacterium]
MSDSLKIAIHREKQRAKPIGYSPILSTYVCEMRDVVRGFHPVLHGLRAMLNDYRQKSDRNSI